MSESPLKKRKTTPGAGNVIGDLSSLLANYAPARLTTNASLSSNQRAALVKLVAASKLITDIYETQVWKGNAAWLKEAEASGNADLAKFARINIGPWDRLDHDKPFVDNVPPKAKGANFYPGDMTADEFRKWVETLSPEDQEKAKGFYHVVRRDSAGALQLIPYSEHYKEWLVPASALLKEAADLVPDPKLKKFLRSRADAFLSNEYRASEADWLQVDSSLIDVTIGPYEVYEDVLLNQKSTFESFIAIRDAEATLQLDIFKSRIQELENSLPVEDKYKNPKIVQGTPIVVVDQIFSGGDAASPMTAAFNLPNDEEVCKKHGNKLVILKNVQNNKFDQVLTPIAKLVLESDQLPLLSFKAFFTHILCHEICHSLGPHHLIASPDTKVRHAIEELHSAIEEAKADIAGLFTLSYLMKKSAEDTQLKAVLTPEMRKSVFVTFLASAFRSIRFGLNEAHGKGQALQLNYILEKGGFRFNEATSKFSVDFEKIDAAVADLTREVLTLQGDGDKKRAQALLDKYAIIPPSMQVVFDKLKETRVPVDIYPIYDDFKVDP